MGFSFVARAKKDPQAVLDYSLDWSDWLHAGETITEHAVSCDDADALITNVALSGGNVRWWLGGGLPGKVYDIRVEIRTSSNRIDQRTLRVPVGNR